jgi:hypothetical protein
LAKRINARLVAERRVDQPDIAAFEVAPVAPGFEAEHLTTGLPAVADLTAGGAAGARFPLVPKRFEKTRAPRRSAIFMQRLDRKWCFGVVNRRERSGGMKPLIYLV